MRKLFATIAAVIGFAAAFGAESQIADLVKFVPEGTNVILYVNASRIMETEFLQSICRNNRRFGNMVDGIVYHEERLNIKGQAIRNLMLCRDTGKATASFYLMNTVVPEDQFEDVFVADYAFFIESQKSQIEFGARRKLIPFFELVRKRSPEQKYAAVYIGSNAGSGNNIVAIVPLGYLGDTLSALQRPPISGEVATVAGHNMDSNSIAWLVASFKSRGTAISGWDQVFDGLVFAEITFDLVGKAEDVVIHARFYSDSTEGRGIRTAGSAARFVGELRKAKEEWLDSIFDRATEDIRERVSSCISIYVQDGNVNLDVNMPADVYAELCFVRPDIAEQVIEMVCAKFQLVEPELLDEAETPAPPTPSGLFD